MLSRVAATYRRAYSGLPRSVWLLASVSFVNRSGTMVLPFLALYLTQEHGFSPSEAGRLLSLYGAGSVAGSYLGGWLCDRLDPLRIQVLSLGLAGVGFFVLATLSSPWAISVTLFFLAMTAEAFRPANGAALAQRTRPELRVRAFALARLAANLGMSVGPAIGGFLAVVAYLWLFVVDGVTCLLAALLVAVLWRRGGGTHQSRTEVAGAASASPWRDRPFLAMLALVVVLACVLFQIMSTYPLSLHQLYGLSESRIGLVYSINTVVIVLFEMLLVEALRARNPMRVVAAGSLLFCGGFGLLPLGASFAFAAFSVLVWTTGEMLTMPFITGVIANRAGEANRGRYLGLFTLSFALAFVLAPGLGTLVYERLGAGVLWYGCGLLGLVLCTGFTLLAPHLRPPAS